MKVIAINLTEDDVNGIAADNGIPEDEWSFARNRVANHRTEIEERLTALANELATSVILMDQL